MGKVRPAFCVPFFVWPRRPKTFCFGPLARGKLRPSFTSGLPRLGFLATWGHVSKRPQPVLANLAWHPQEGGTREGGRGTARNFSEQGVMRCSLSAHRPRPCKRWKWSSSPSTSTADEVGTLPDLENDCASHFRTVAFSRRGLSGLHWRRRGVPPRGWGRLG